MKPSLVPKHGATAMQNHRAARGRQGAHGTPYGRFFTIWYKLKDVS